MAPPPDLRSVTQVPVQVPEFSLPHPQPFLLFLELSSFSGCRYLGRFLSAASYLGTGPFPPQPLGHLWLSAGASRGQRGFLFVWAGSQRFP